MLEKVPDPVTKVWAWLNESKPTYLVGGALRDLLGEGVPQDWDLATRLTPDAVETMGRQKGYRVIPTGKAFGTVTWLTEAGPIEVTTFRREGRYRDGRHPEQVQFATSIEEDLSRRDFTMNAIAMAFDGTLIDPHGGVRDLARGHIVTVGDPEDRFHEDPLRMLRAIRFVGRDVNGRPMRLDSKAFRAIQQLKDRIVNVSGERQRDEITKLLATPHFSDALAMLDETGILGVVWPEWVACRNFIQHRPHHGKPIHEHLLETARWGSTPLLRLVGLLHDIAKPSCFWQDESGIGHFYGHDRVGALYVSRMLARLAWDSATIERVALLIELHRFPWEVAEDRAIRRLIREHGEEVVAELLDLRSMDVRGAGSVWDQEALVRRRVTTLQTEPPAALRQVQASGHDIMKWTGLSPGPEVGRWLTRLQDWVDDDPRRNRREMLKAYVLRLTRATIEADEVPTPSPRPE